MVGSFRGTFIVNADTLRSVNNWQDHLLQKCDSSGNFIWIKHIAAGLLKVSQEYLILMIILVPWEVM